MKQILYPQVYNEMRNKKYRVQGCTSPKSHEKV
jgi:hypothetical protein